MAEVKSKSFILSEAQVKQAQALSWGNIAILLAFRIGDRRVAVNHWTEDVMEKLMEKSC